MNQHNTTVNDAVLTFEIKVRGNVYEMLAIDDDDIYNGLYDMKMHTFRIQRILSFLLFTLTDTFHIQRI